MPTKARKTWAQQLQQNHSFTITMSCAIVGLSRCAYYYQPKLQDDSVIVSVLNAITDRHLRWGFPKCGMATHFQTKKLRGKCFLNSTGGK